MDMRLVLAACAAFISTPAYSDACDKLAGQTICLQFIFSTDNLPSQFAVHFGPAGGVRFPASGPVNGTYSCKGFNFVEVNALWGGFETHQWLGRARKSGSELGISFGKSVTNDYLYRITTAADGCQPDNAVSTLVNKSSLKD